MAMTPQDDPYRSIRRHMGVAFLLLLVLLTAIAAWLSGPFGL